MATGLQYKETLSIISGGYAGEDVGSSGVEQSWTDANLIGSSDVVYYYHDSYTSDNNNSTKVEVRLLDSWSASVDTSTNRITITLNTVLHSIVRTVVGNPSPESMSITIKRNSQGSPLWTSGGCVNASTNASYISSPITLEAFTFTLAPGEEYNNGTIYYRNNACGHDSDPTPSMYVDEFGMGVSFRNVLPPNYIPGKVWNGSNWLSHNRPTNGHAKLYTGSAWGNDMKTINGGVGTNDPPLIKHSDGFKNMRRTGVE